VPKNKVVPIEEAMSHVESGMSIAVGGFIGQGDPLTLIDYLKTMDVRDLTIYENDGGFQHRGTVELALQGKIKKIVASHVGTTPDFARLMNEGKIEVEATPQGTLAEMLRCGGAGLGSCPPSSATSPSSAPTPAIPGEISSIVAPRATSTSRRR
jgi:acetate CoA/acetoacetate CoA-transferase alpha subunit